MSRYKEYEDDIKDARLKGLTYEETISHLTSEEILKLSKRSTTTSNVKKAEVIQQVSKVATAVDKGKGPCKKCDCPHDTKHCKNLLHCTFCNKDGHLTRKCFKKPKGNEIKVSQVKMSSNKEGNNDNEKLIIMDSGATMHVTGDESNLIDKRLVEPISVIGYDGHTTEVNIKGQLPYFGETLLVPGTQDTLVSMSQLIDEGFKIVYNRDSDTWVTEDLREEQMEFKRVMKNGHGVYAVVVVISLKIYIVVR